MACSQRDADSTTSGRSLRTARLHKRRDTCVAVKCPVWVARTRSGSAGERAGRERSGGSTLQLQGCKRDLAGVRAGRRSRIRVCED